MCYDNKVCLLFFAKKIINLTSCTYAHSKFFIITVITQNTHRHVCIPCVTIYVALYRNNVVVYLAITQLRAIRLSATVIAFVSSVAPITVLVGRRTSWLYRKCYQYFQPYVQVKYCESFFPDITRLIPFAIGILSYVYKQSIIN